MPADVFAHVRSVKDRGAAAHAEWNKKFDSWKSAHGEKAALLERLVKRELPADWDAQLPEFEAGKDVAPRAASGHVINAIAAVLPEFWGGYRVIPESIEFWQGQPGRKHDRFIYRRETGTGWTIERLSP
jgi:transketolase